METRQSSRKDYFRRALRLTCTLMLSLWMASSQNPVSSQNAVRDQGPVTDKSSRARAVELIAQARRAAGIDLAAGLPRTLSASGKSRRLIRYLSVRSPNTVEDRERELSGKFELDFAPPDRFRMRMKGATLGGYGFSIEEVVNGDEAWRNPPLSVRSFNRDPRVIDVGDVERTLLMQARTARQQIALNALGWLVTTPTSYTLDFHDAGIFVHQGESLNAVIAETPDGLQISLLFDQQTGLLVGLATAYYDRFQEAVIAEVSSVDRRFVAATYARAREERRRRQRPRQRQEVIWRFSDHRPISGILIPHQSAIFFNGLLIEENRITSVRVNQSINPKKFIGKERVKY
jgi:hypothetical protein